MNSDNNDAGSRGTIRFLELGYPGNIAIASIQSQHDLMPFRIAVDVGMIPTEKLPTDATFSDHHEGLFSPHQLDEDHAAQR